MTNGIALAPMKKPNKFDIRSIFFGSGKKMGEDRTSPSELPERFRPMVISVMNQKGGCGKTTTVVNLSAALTKRGYRVLVIDMDPQAHASLGLGVDKDSNKPTVYDLMLDEATNVFDVIRPSTLQGLDVIPASTRLAEAQLELADQSRGELILKRALKPCHKLYDFIFVDCPPTLNLLTLNALVCAKRILIPVQTHYYAMQGMKDLFHTIEGVRKRFNPRLEILGILACIYDRKVGIAQEMLKTLRDYFQEQMFVTVIHSNGKLIEAPMVRAPISVYAPNSSAARNFDQFATEVINNVTREN
jgi:chromosome partitioning protein